MSHRIKGQLVANRRGKTRRARGSRLAAPDNLE